MEFPDYCPFLVNDAKKAIEYARRLFNRSPPASDGNGPVPGPYDDVYDNTRANAFKHSYWLALMVNSIAQHWYLADNFDIALLFADAHEAGTPNDITNRRNTAIDNHNNRVGYDLAVANSPDAYGKKHNDVFDCNALRNRIVRARQVGFKKGSHSFIPTTPANRLVFRWKYPGGNRDDPPTVRLKQKNEFASGEPCA